MTTTSKPKTIRIDATQGTISAESMVISLVKSGVALENIAIAKTLTDAQMANVKAALA